MLNAAMIKPMLDGDKPRCTALRAVVTRVPTTDVDNIAPSSMTQRMAGSALMRSGRRGSTGRLNSAQAQRPLKTAGRFSRKAFTPSR